MRTWWQKRILLNIWSRWEQRGLYVGPPFQWSIKKKFEIPNCEFQQIFGPHAHSQLSIFGRTHITCTCAFCQNSNCTRTCTFVHVQFPKMHKHTFAVYKQRSVNFNKAFLFFQFFKKTNKKFLHQLTRAKINTSI